MNENLTYLPLVKNHKELEVIRWKHNFAMSQLKQHLGYLKIFQECQNSYKEAFRKLGVK